MICLKSFKMVGMRMQPYIRSIHISERVAVGLSGGVDSAISAYLLKKEGYDVHGVFMKNWSYEEETGKLQCPLKDDYVAARKVAASLSIPLTMFDFEKEYWTDVFSPTLQSYEKGETPNPDVLCNRCIKFDAFAKRCFSLGYAYIATGHYCRVNRAHPLSCYSTALPELLKGKDAKKDQSYFLSEINGEILKQTLFPVGEMTKMEVRGIASEIGLDGYIKKESMGICFIGERNMKAFLPNYIDIRKGSIVNGKGERIGEHDGMEFYTIGQGVKLANQKAKYYVCEKRMRTNEIVVCSKEDPALYHSLFSIDNHQMYWVHRKPPTLLLEQCHRNAYYYPIQCQIRYQNAYYPCNVSLDEYNECYVVASELPMLAVTLGQTCVFYDHDVCLGGGTICSILN